MEFPSVEYERDPGRTNDEDPWMQEPGERRHGEIVSPYPVIEAFPRERHKPRHCFRVSRCLGGISRSRRAADENRGGVKLPGAPCELEEGVDKDVDQHHNLDFPYPDNETTREGKSRHHFDHLIRCA